MTSILRKIVLAPVALAVAALSVNTARAESRVVVPFTFTVAGKVCPAGNYSIDRDPNHSLVTLRNVKSGQSFSWILSAGASDNSSSSVRLRFDEVGADHALQSVQYGQQTTSNLDNSTHADRMAARSSQGR